MAKKTKHTKHRDPNTAKVTIGGLGPATEVSGEPFKGQDFFKQTGLDKVLAPEPVEQRAVEPRSLSLYEIEAELTEAMAAWLDADAMVQEGSEGGLEVVGAAENLRHIVFQYLEAAKDKRDKVARFMMHLESQEDLAAKEIQRLQNRRRSFANARDRLKQYVVAVAESQEVTQLEGVNTVMRVQRTPPRIDILDEGLIPARHLVPQPPVPDKRSIMDEYKMLDKAREKKLAKDPKADVPWPSVPGTVRNQGKTVVIR